PYMTKVDTITVASMATAIGELKRYIKIPFGVNVLWDGEKTLDLAKACGADFVREIYSGVYASDFGMWNTDFGRVARHRKSIDAGNVKLIFNILPEAAKYLADRDIVEIAKSTVFNCKADALCVSGLTAGSETNSQILKRVKDAVPDTVVLANTGCRPDTIEAQLSVADGAVVGTTFKVDGKFENGVDEKRVREFMSIVKKFRGQE
ncbi:MAG: BtpA/SgcQ family protein, partial [Enterocloster aldenensis]